MNLHLEKLALTCLINNSIVFDLDFYHKHFQEDSSFLFQNKVIKSLSKEKKLRFISKRHLYSYANKQINSPDLDFKKGVLRKIEDQIFIKQINFNTLFFENYDLNFLALKITEIINPFVINQQYEEAATLRNKYHDIINNYILDFWPNLDEINFKDLQKDIFN
jgi:hypothetical protein